MSTPRRPREPAAPFDLKKRLEELARGEMVARGASIPTTWLIIIPIVNIFYLWKWSAGVEHVTGGKVNGAVMFLLMWLVNIVGIPYAQSQFNKVEA